MNIKIVQADRCDAVDILQLQKIAYQQEAVLYDDWTIPPLTQTLPEIQIAFESQLFLKALFGDRIVGSVRASQDSGTCTIGRLIVHPDYQRKGIGSLLMKQMASFFPHAKRYEVFTGTKSTDNIRLYQKLGYHAYRQQDLSPKVRIVFMEKHKKPLSVVSKPSSGPEIEAGGRFKPEK